MTLAMPKRIFLFATTMCLISQIAIASDYEVPWFDTTSVGTGTLDDGGYSIRATIVQFAPAPTGDSIEYEIRGGFWPGVGSTPSCLADLNEDGLLNFFDVSEFLVAYTEKVSLADFNNDGLFNFFDVSAFLTSYQDGCP